MNFRRDVEACQKELSEGKWWDGTAPLYLWETDGSEPEVVPVRIDINDSILAHRDEWGDLLVWLDFDTQDLADYFGARNFPFTQAAIILTPKRARHLMEDLRRLLTKIEERATADQPDAGAVAGEGERDGVRETDP